MQTQKLLDLADHLDFGKLGHTEFSFRTWGARVQEENVCKTLGCAVGECPTLFPEDWRFSGDLRPVFGKNKGAISSAMEFFELNRQEAEHLFLPMHQMIWLYNGNKLYGDASKHHVADNIRAFVKANDTPFKLAKNRLLIKLNNFLETIL